MTRREAEYSDVQSHSLRGSSTRDTVAVTPATEAAAQRSFSCTTTEAAAPAATEAAAPETVVHQTVALHQGRATGRAALLTP